MTNLYALKQLNGTYVLREAQPTPKLFSSHAEAQKYCIVNRVLNVEIVVFKPQLN